VLGAGGDVGVQSCKVGRTLGEIRHHLPPPPETVRHNGSPPPLQSLHHRSCIQNTGLISRDAGSPPPLQSLHHRSCIQNTGLISRDARTTDLRPSSRCHTRSPPAQQSLQNVMFDLACAKAGWALLVESNTFHVKRHAKPISKCDTGLQHGQPPAMQYSMTPAFVHYEVSRLLSLGILFTLQCYSLYSVDWRKANCAQIRTKFEPADCSTSTIIHCSYCKEMGLALLSRTLPEKLLKIASRH